MQGWRGALLVLLKFLCLLITLHCTSVALKWLKSLAQWTLLWTFQAMKLYWINLVHNYINPIIQPLLKIKEKKKKLEWPSSGPSILHLDDGKAKFDLYSAIRPIRWVRLNSTYKAKLYCSLSLSQHLQYRSHRQEFLSPDQDLTRWPTQPKYLWLHIAFSSVCSGGPCSCRLLILLQAGGPFFFFFALFQGHDTAAEGKKSFQGVIHFLREKKIITIKLSCSTCYFLRKNEPIFLRKEHQIKHGSEQ